jgi:uncharacterized protein YhaN
MSDENPSFLEPSESAHTEMGDLPTEAETVVDQREKTFSLEYVEELRAEAVKWRQDSRQKVDRAVADLKKQQKQLTEELAKATEERDLNVGAAVELTKYKKALEAGLSPENVLEVVSLIKETDEDAIESAVERMKSLIGKAPEKARPIDPSQGSGSHVPLNGDPILEKVKRMVGA